MDSIKQRHLRRSVGALRRQFGQCAGGVLSRVLPAAEIEAIVRGQTGRYRQRTYAPLDTLRLFVNQVLTEDRACQDAVGRRLSERVSAGKRGCSLNTGPYCKARQRLPVGIPVQLMQRIGRRLEAKAPAGWQWHGRRVKLFDGTTLSMPDTPSNQAAFPQSARQAPGLGFPVVRIGALIGLASGAVVSYAMAACKGKGSGEQALLRQLDRFLDAHDVLLADALHATWWTLADLQARHIDVVMAQHGARRTDFRRGLRLGTKDHVVAWPRPPRPKWMDPTHYNALPPQLTMREIDSARRVLVTTLLDPVAAPPRALHALYALRWNIEVDFRTIKNTLAMDVLRCKSRDMIEKEIAVSLLAYNLVRWTMATAAYLAELLPRSLGFSAAKQLLGAFADHLRRAPGKRTSFMIATVLASIAMLKLPCRPGRIEPRKKKRRPKPLPLLTVPRALAREAIRIARALR